MSQPREITSVDHAGQGSNPCLSSPPPLENHSGSDAAKVPEPPKVPNQYQTPTEHAGLAAEKYQAPAQPLDVKGGTGCQEKLCPHMRRAGYCSACPVVLPAAPAWRPVGIFEPPAPPLRRNLDVCVCGHAHEGICNLCACLLRMPHQQPRKEVNPAGATREPAPQDFAERPADHSLSPGLLELLDRFPPAMRSVVQGVDAALRSHREPPAHPHSAGTARPWTVNVWQEGQHWDVAVYEGPRYRYGSYGVPTEHRATSEGVGFVRRATDAASVTVAFQAPAEPQELEGPRDVDVTDPEGAADRCLADFPEDIREAVQFELKRRREFWEEVRFEDTLWMSGHQTVKDFEDEGLVRLFMALGGGAA